MNLPNKLTIMRMVLMPVFVICFYIPSAYRLEIAAFVFIMAYITDYIDGRIARERNLITNFGKLMDPIADKLLTISAFIMLTYIGRVSPIATIVVMARELLISGFRLVAVESGVVIAASILGKLKTVTHFIAIIAVLVWERAAFTPFPLDQVLLWLSVVITIWSGVDYIVKNVRNLKLDL